MGLKAIPWYEKRESQDSGKDNSCPGPYLLDLAYRL